MAKVLGKQQLTAANLATAVGLTFPSNKDVHFAKVQAAIAPVRYQLTGDDPTNILGHRVVNDNEPTVITIDDGLADAKFILESGSPTLEVTYYGSD